MGEGRRSSDRSPAVCKYALSISRPSGLFLGDGPLQDEMKPMGDQGLHRGKKVRYPRVVERRTERLVQAPVTQ